MKESKTRHNKRQTGTYYEQQVSLYLQNKGYRILKMNYRCKIGEIDIIAQEGDYTVFIEVKYRNDKGCGYPREAVNWKKQQTILKVATYYMLCEKGYECACRFDVVEVLGETIAHFENAF